MNYVSSYLMGGLGNQLFQIFVAISYGMKYKRRIIFAYNETSPGSVLRYTFWDTFLKHLDIFTTRHEKSKLTNQHVLSFKRLNESSHNYQILHDTSIKSILLFGYFQSYKYFEEYYSTISSLLRLDQQRNEVKEEYINLFTKTNNDICSIHFRIGDYKNIQDCHPVLTTEYYKKALKRITSSNIISRVLYFYQECDENDVLEHINILQEQDENTNIEFIGINHNIPDWKQMLLMSCCNHNIIANSTFSWWGAYFNNNTSKTITYPDQWFGPKLSEKNIDDLCPNDWNKINIIKN